MQESSDLRSPVLTTSRGPLWLREVDRLLRGQATESANLRQGGLPVTSDRLQLAVVVLGFVYGLCMGTYALLKGGDGAFLQLLSGMIKVPALFLLTLLVTFPSLYVFNALVGCRLSVLALWRLLTSSVALNMAVLASFGPIVAFFSLSTTSYSFMLLLNVAVFAIAGAFGLRFLIQTLQRLTLIPPEPELAPPVIQGEPVDLSPIAKPVGQKLSPQVRFVFRCWILVFALVGAQMSWILRPFLGVPNQAFSFFRARESNFFEAVWNHLIYLIK